MGKRREKVEETRRRIAQATFELHSTIGPADTTMALIAARAGLPRQTVFRNFASRVELFRSCIGFGLELNPPPAPGEWEAVPPGIERLRCGLTELYRWFAAVEPVMTNMVRDIAAVPLEALQPLVEFDARAHEVLCRGWDEARVSVLVSLAIDFANWKKLRREHDMPSRTIVDFWAGQVDCHDVKLFPAATDAA